MGEFFAEYEADEADLAEQRQSIGGEVDDLTGPSHSPDEANEADVLEQNAEVPADDDDYMPG